jgi:hypothetical protein
MEITKIHVIMVNYLKIFFSKVSSSYIIFLHLIAVRDLFGFLYIKFLLRLSSLSPWSETKQHVKATGPKLIKEIDPVVVRNVSGSWWPEEYNGTLVYLSLNCLCIYIWLLGGQSATNSEVYLGHMFVLVLNLFFLSTSCVCLVVNVCQGFHLSTCDIM